LKRQRQEKEQRIEAIKKVREKFKHSIEDSTGGSMEDLKKITLVELMKESEAYELMQK
jgi:PAB1-binding protein PBP1